MPRCTPCATVEAKRPDISRSDLPIDGPTGEKYQSPGRRQHHRDAGATITTVTLNNKSP
jgi:hypothetical protein